MSTILARPRKPYTGRRWDKITLMASAEHTVEANAAGDSFDLGDWDKMLVVLDITASATDAADVLDVYIDVSWDEGTTWYNAVHFAQQAGNGSAKKELATLNGGVPDDTDPDADIAITADAGSGVVRPSLVGQFVRVRSTVVRDTGVDEAHTFSVVAIVQ